MHVAQGMLVGSAILVGGCGGSSAQPADPGGSHAGGGAPATDDAASGAPAAATKSGTAAAADEAASGIPTRCAGSDGSLCTPGASFAKRLCEGDFPTVALHLFSGKAPWTKGYLARKTKAWSASGAGSSNEELPADEEVVVLLKRGAPNLGGIEVSGTTGGFEVLRWDGGCVTLQEGELLFDPPPKPKIARIVWKRLELDTRDALTEVEAIHRVYVDHRKHCKGVSMGEVSLPCVKADKALGEAIADYVRGGGELAKPTRLP